MRFSTVFSVLACGAMAMAAAVTPDVLVARSNTEISNVISGLSGKCATILPKFDTCGDYDCTQGLVGEIVVAIKEATSACVGLKGIVSLSLAKPIAQVIIDVSVKLNDHQTSCKGQCGDVSVYAQIDACFAALLAQLEICVFGIIALVATLVIKVLAILKFLNLVAILKLCALV